jgi:hypothetical protein
MRSKWTSIALPLVLACPFTFHATDGRADPLLRSGIGLQTCAKLEPSLKVGGGLDHLPNALLFYWVQDYVSENTDYVDAGAVDEPVITKLVVEFCKANPDKRPVNAIDSYLQGVAKIEAKESDAFDPWDH